MNDKVHIPLGQWAAAELGRQLSLSNVNDIVVLKGLEPLQRRPEMYIGVGGAIGARISTSLAHDALVLGAKCVRIDVVQGWHVVSADLDWLTAPMKSDRVVAIPQLFQGMIPLWEAGQNFIRSEALVGAYARAAYVATVNETLQVVGEGSLPEDVRAALCPNGCVRSVAFVRDDS